MMEVSKRQSHEEVVVLIQKLDRQLPVSLKYFRYSSHSYIVHYIASLYQADEEPFESTLDSSPVNLTIGSSSLFWDIALSTMQLDEVSKFVVSSNYTYGDKGLSDIVPPGAKVIYEVELLDIIENNDNNQRIRSDSVEDKMMKVQQLKQQGNDEFHNDNFKAAAKLYSKGKGYFGDIQI